MSSNDKKKLKTMSVQKIETKIKTKKKSLWIYVLHR